MGCIRARTLSKALTTNAQTSSFAAKPPTGTVPNYDGVVRVTEASGEMPKKLHVMPYGIGADNDTFSIRIIGWTRIRGDATNPTDLWVPHRLAEFACTLSTAVGVAGTPVGATSRFCDTMTTVTGTFPLWPGTDSGGAQTLGQMMLVSPADNTPAYAVIQTMGAELIEFQFDQTLNTPEMNALYKLYGE